MFEQHESSHGRDAPSASIQATPSTAQPSLTTRTMRRTPPTYKLPPSYPYPTVHAVASASTLLTPDQWQIAPTTANSVGVAVKTTETSTTSSTFPLPVAAEPPPIRAADINAPDGPLELRVAHEETTKVPARTTTETASIMALDSTMSTSAAMPRRTWDEGDDDKGDDEDEVQCWDRYGQGMMMRHPRDLLLDDWESEDDDANETNMAQTSSTLVDAAVMPMFRDDLI